MLSKPISKKNSRVIVRLENTDIIFKAKKSSRKTPVFTQENMSYVNDFNEQNTNNSAPAAAGN